ncbi:MAG TPA: NAD-dependent epimerase/dehydratase family protein [Solirubrobacteraceae bacterium]|jgi:dihydroflavonol-4-reductase|nr:NAD-dependent epimerase/dehydratase family protein [Solirubrobacteraceae bacterium]
MARVLLTGGGGYIGGELAAALLARGDEVVGLARTDASAAALAARGASVVRGDVLDADGLGTAMRGCELVYHVAGVNSHCPKDPAWLVRVNVEGTENVARAAARHNVSRVVVTSSAATIGEPEGTVGSEETPHRGSYISLYERSKHDGERAAFAVGAETGLEVVALNPSSVQGPPRSSGNGAIIIAFLSGRLRAFVNTQISVVDVRDVVAAQLLAADSGRAGGRYVLNGVTLPATDALRMVAELAGINGRVALVPRRLARGGAALVELVYRARGATSPLCRARVDTILHGHRYDGSLATRELGLRYTPVTETFRRTIEWAVAAGLVTRPLPGLALSG